MAQNGLKYQLYRKTTKRPQCGSWMGIFEKPIILLNKSVLFIKAHNILQSIKAHFRHFVKIWWYCAIFRPESFGKTLGAACNPKCLVTKDSNLDIKFINIKTFWIVDGGQG